MAACERAARYPLKQLAGQVGVAIQQRAQPRKSVGHGRGRPVVGRDTRRRVVRAPCRRDVKYLMQLTQQVWPIAEACAEPRHKAVGESRQSTSLGSGRCGGANCSFGVCAPFPPRAWTEQVLRSMALSECCAICSMLSVSLPNVPML